ncbi:nitrogen fixation protein NifM [Dechloromonas sp. XY25]|uniref:peptidylprolyl isomerase n=1 Tax=Dechloromonas hankyongensis TaxID=2908002 RepID=A0ABS9K158_9RHOO|nr:nitrogen fixation protein NifM [Dechloromonas hankyongensis]MCG2576901.1 nitrogen fixation protein NifM [Dechloromonas hankyongensis]
MQALGYLELKLSWELFQKGPEALSEPERHRLDGVARKQDSIEQSILASAAAANVVVPAATLANRIGEIRQRYPAQDEFAHDLERSGLTMADLEQAVERDLRVEAVLEKVASAVPAVSLVDAEIYYRLHPEAFDRPEARRLRHILITFNNDSEKEKALLTLEGLRSKLKDPEAFAAAALRDSQCPTAMEGGMLGVVKHEQLYAALEPAAFALNVGEISAVLESPIGLHIIRCDEILPNGMLPFAEVGARIVERLTDKRRREAQRDWIKAQVGKNLGKKKEAEAS